MRWALAVAAVFLVLDLAALDDITTGSEPSFWQEYLFLALSLIPLAVVGLMWSRRRHPVDSG
jgi:hypothetical protein